MINPFAEYIVFDIHGLGAGSWLLGICHSPASIIILVCNRCCTLWNSEVSKDILKKQNQFSAICGFNEFSFGGGLCDGWL